MIIELCNKNWITSDVLSSSLILVKMMLFQWSGRGQAEDDAWPNISPDSKSLLLGLLNGVSFVSEIFWEYGKEDKMSDRKPRRSEIKFPQCIRKHSIYVYILGVLMRDLRIT